MKSIFSQTVINALRQKHLQILAAVLFVLFILVAFNGIVAYKARMQSFEKAKQAVRTAWLNQGPQNPHSSAHYGHYIFQPVDAMQFLDNGIRPFAGSILRLEGHAQNEPAFSPAQDKTELSRFGEMSFAWILQVLIPLFIILLCFNAVSADKENQNLKLLVAQGISNQDYLWGKILAMFTLVVLCSGIGLLIQLLAYLIFIADSRSLSASTILVWFLGYVVFFLIISSLSVVVSAWVKKSSSSMLLQLAGWVFFMIVAPKITAGLGAYLYPIEHKAAFNKALKEDREKGIDGHNPADKRSKKFMDSVIAFYKIDTNTVKDVKEALPVNVDGLVMQADEDYANLVYDKHFTRIRGIISKQNAVTTYASFLNPYLAIRNTSMGISESDFKSHLHLMNEAEQYRRYLIKTLNDKMAYGGSKTGDWDWKVDNSYWNTVKDFIYPTTSLGQSLRNHAIEILALFSWLLMLVLGVVFTSKKLSII